MAKKVKKKSGKQPGKTSGQKIKHSWLNPVNKLPLFVLMGLAFLLYANTLANGYAIDDSVTNIDNKFVEKGFAGIPDILSHDTFTGKTGQKLVIVAGSRYRPLSLVTFAIEKGIMGDYNPMVGHLVNLLLYGWTGCLIYLLLSRLLQKYESSRWYLSIPFLTAALFLLHPVHTEVVANIKGRDEILALIGSFLALVYTIRYLETKSSKYLVFTGIAFFLGLLSKENTITFLAIIPLTVYVFTNYDLKKHVMAFAPIGVTAVLYLALRQSIVGGGGDSMTDSLINNPFMGATVMEKYGTICYTFGEYLRLLFFPHPLTFDYYPYHIGLTGFGVVSIVSLLLYVGLGIYALVKLPSKSVVAYGILFSLITFSIVSNVFVNIGVFMGERFLYFPSLGFCLVITWLLTEGMKRFFPSGDKQIPVLLGVLGLVGLLFAGKTIIRNFDWKDNFTLVSKDIQVSKNSTKCNYALGELYLKQALKEQDKSIKDNKLRQAIPLLEKAIEIYPEYKSAYSKLADTHYYLGDHRKSIATNIKLIQIAPKESTVQNVMALLQQQRDQGYQLDVFGQLVNAMPQSFIANFNYGRLLVESGTDRTRGNQLIQKAAQLNEQNSRSSNYQKNKQMLAPYLNR